LDEPATTSVPRASSPSAPAPSHRASPPRRLSSTQLLDGANEVEIEHRGAMYRLRLTSLDKLILTK
jgi:hemin uptake protein HemP